VEICFAFDDVTLGNFDEIIETIVNV